MKNDVAYNPLMISSAIDLGIEEYEIRLFMKEFTAYVNLRDRDDCTHKEACTALRSDQGYKRWRDACDNLYRMILDQPEMYW